MEISGKKVPIAEIRKTLEEIALKQSAIYGHTAEISKKAVVDSFVSKKAYSPASVWAWLAPNTKKKYAPMDFYMHLQDPTNHAGFVVRKRATISAAEFQNSMSSYENFLNKENMTLDRHQFAEYLKKELSVRGYKFSEKTIIGWMVPSAKESHIPSISKETIENLLSSKKIDFGKYTHIKTDSSQLISLVLEKGCFKTPNAMCFALSEATGIPVTTIRPQLSNRGRRLDARVYEELLYWSKCGNGLAEEINPVYTFKRQKAARAVIDRIKVTGNFRSLNAVYAYVGKEIGISQKNVKDRLLRKTIDGKFYKNLLVIETKFNKNAADNIDRKLQRLIYDVSGGQKINMYEVRKEVDNGKNAHVDSKSVNFLLLNWAKLICGSGQDHWTTKLCGPGEREQISPYINDFVDVLHKVSYNGFDPNLSLNALLDVISVRITDSESESFKLDEIGDYIGKCRHKISPETAGKYERLAALRENHLQKQKARIAP